MTGLVSPRSKNPLSFPLVGIGASAGGLEAISELMAEIPSPAGMAFLVVQHLDPSRQSLLPAILKTRVSLHVEEAAEGMAIQKEHVYVIPPNKGMFVVDGQIHLKARSAASQPPMPIDDLFQSMATDQGHNAIGIILSGSGTDGALGLQAIQSEGGITFAQDGSARFDSMPRAAIDLGCVDRVLSPTEIGIDIVDMGNHPHLLSAEDERELVAGTPEVRLQPIFRLLQNACSIDFSRYKDGTIQRRLSRRMALCQVTSVADYVKVLEVDPAETLALGRDLLIHVTEFFRDTASFDALTQTVFPRLLGVNGPDAELRIWVPGCATGEEVYSIAICLLEYLGERTSTMAIKLFGTDISAGVLDTARAGRYIENIARNVSPERLARFFERDGQYFCVNKSVRDLCTFARHDLVSDPPFSRMNLISCRNLLIYLNSATQQSVMPLFHYALRPGGVLMLGPSESVGTSSELFGNIEAKGSRLYSKKVRLVNAAGLRLMPRAPRAGAAIDSGSGQTAAPDEASLIRDEVNRTAIARYVPAYVLCDDDLNVIEYHGDTSSFLFNPSGPPVNKLQRLVRPEIFLAVSDAIKQVREDGKPARKESLRIESTGGSRPVSLEVHSVRSPQSQGSWFLVFLEQASAEPGGLASGRREPLKSLVLEALRQRLGRRAASAKADPRDMEIARLNEEVSGLRTQLRSMLEEHESAREELKSTEEELLSSNEEFQGTNEELEAAKEELQSLNEELSTTNDELSYRNQELKVLHDDVVRARDYADAIIDTMSEPLLVLDSSLHVTRANLAFYRTFQTDREKTLGTLLYALGNQQWNIPSLRDLLEKVLPQEAVVRDFHITHVFQDVGLRTMRLNAARVVGRIREWIVLTIGDVTQLQLAIEQLKTVDQQKDEFLALLAHELRNPLAAISNGLEIWGRPGVDEDTQKRARDSARRQLLHEIALIDDLLDVSRITRGNMRLRADPVNLTEIVESGVAAMRGAAQSRRHALTVVVPADPIWIEGDATRLEQIVTNLLDNAIKYTPQGGRIEVSLAREGDEAKLTVEDNGIGMTAEFLPRIFTIFVQAERLPHRNASGLGLGLALVQRLAILHKGTVRAFSEGLGRGSRFVVRLPASTSYAVVPLPKPTGETPATFKQATPRRILVLDDNADAGESLAMLLRLEGHDVLVCDDGRSALMKAEGYRPQVIVLDIALSEMDGFEVARQLRGISGLRDSLLIAHSGLVGEEHRRRAREAGFDHFLTKPATIAELNESIGSVPYRPQADGDKAGP
jgi:two-component system CheB/CheR fusion protein